MRREFPEAPIVGLGAVVLDGTNVVLVCRGQEPLKGQWSLPGGALEVGETLQQGVAREVLEETGLVVEPVGMIEVLDRITHDPESGKVRYHYVLIDFVCRVTGGALLGGSDAEEARWVEQENLHEFGLSPVTLAVIEKAFKEVC